MRKRCDCLIRGMLSVYLPFFVAVNACCMAAYIFVILGIQKPLDKISGLPKKQFCQA